MKSGGEAYSRVLTISVEPACSARIEIPALSHQRASLGAAAAVEGREHTITLPTKTTSSSIFSDDSAFVRSRRLPIQQPDFHSTTRDVPRTN